MKKERERERNALGEAARDRPNRRHDSLRLPLSALNPPKKITSIESSDRRSWRPLADYTRERERVRGDFFAMGHHDSPLDGGMLTDARKYSRSSISDLPATEKEVNSHSLVDTVGKTSLDICRETPRFCLTLDWLCSSVLRNVCLRASSIFFFFLLFPFLGR